ncbi:MULTISPECIES: hypothetical protein [unclassified Phaeobacter]|uniref:hypothetical protein n=1 Tax=unclassified Phaeobacter TaxID=2621772 RepID=UPI003A8529B4
MAKSFASTVHLDTDRETSLDRQEALSPKFQEAQSDLEAAYAEQDSGGSSMVKEDDLSHDMHPDAEMRAEQDKASFDERWEQERQASQDDLAAAYEEQASFEDQQRELSKDDWEQSL